MLPEADMNCKSLNNQNKGGFTLLELIVTLAIFSIISSLAYGGLYAILNISDHNNARSQRLSAIQSALLFMQRDIEQMVDRPVRTDQNQIIPAMYSIENGDYVMELTRAGWANPLNSVRSNLQRVAYKIEDDSLYRVYWPELDRTANTPLVESKMLSGFDDIQIRFLDDQNRWHQTWPDTGLSPGNSSLPVAIEINIDTHDLGSIKRLFQIKYRPGE
jgi:general secretion pathway protein J